VAKCGGVVAREARSNLDANFLSIFRKMIMKMTLKQKKSWRKTQRG
jgi:hypothetical protein